MGLCPRCASPYLATGKPRTWSTMRSIQSRMRCELSRLNEFEILQVCACLFGQALSHATSRPAMALTPGLRACKLASLLTADVLCCTHHHPATPPGTRCGIFRPHAGEGTTGRDRSGSSVGLRPNSMPLMTSNDELQFAISFGCVPTSLVA